jgi:hypothetical protein
MAIFNSYVKLPEGNPKQTWITGGLSIFGTCGPSLVVSSSCSMVGGPLAPKLTWTIRGSQTWMALVDDLGVPSSDIVGW